MCKLTIKIACRTYYLIKSAEYCHCKRHGYKTEELFQRHKTLCKIAVFDLEDTHLFNRSYWRSPHSPPDPPVCPSVSKHWALTSKWTENIFWKMTQHFRDHPITALRRGCGRWGSPPGCHSVLFGPHVLYIHHTFTIRNKIIIKQHRRLITCVKM